jgi:hypothetical protein
LYKQELAQRPIDPVIRAWEAGYVERVCLVGRVRVERLEEYRARRDLPPGLNWNWNWR